MLASQWVWQRTKSVSIPTEEQNAGRVVDYFYRMEFHITPRFFPIAITCSTSFHTSQYSTPFPTPPPPRSEHHNLVKKFISLTYSKLRGDHPPTPATHYYTMLRPPILAVIAMATVVSTVASMAGGLVMYFESLISLEDGVRKTSETEVASLEGSVMDVLYITQGAAATVRAFTYNPESIRSPDPKVYTNQSRAVCFSIIHSLPIYAIGYVLVPYNVSADDSVYNVVWASPQSYGGYEYIHGFYHKGLPGFTVNATHPTYMPISSHYVNNATGELGSLAYIWNGVSYLVDMLPEGYDPRSGVIPTGDSAWQQRHGGPTQTSEVAYKWRPPRSWQSSDNTVYAYSGYDSVHIPPPAPHPWSKYRAVLITSMYRYATWERSIKVYKVTNPDTTVVVIGTETGIVYASTTGHSMVHPDCLSGRLKFSVNVALSCATRVHDLPVFIQEAVNDLASTPYSTYTQLKLDGVDHFVRKGVRLHQDAVLLWMRPKSSVDGKVQQALVVLIVFTAVVFVFDLVVSGLEVVFIAKPLKQIANAIHAIGDLETDTAGRAIAEYGASRCIVVREIDNVMHGMRTAVARLGELRTFMPASVRPLKASSIEEDDNSDQSSSHSSRDSSIPSNRSFVIESAGSAICLTQLHLAVKDIGLLYVNSVGWWARLNDVSDDILKASTELAVHVVALTSTRHGVLDSFSGDRFLVGWNTSKKSCEPAYSAVGTALDLNTTLRNRHELSCGVTSGRARVGNVGTTHLRRFTVLSPLVPWVAVLETYSKANRLGCVTDAETAGRVRHSVKLCVVDAILRNNSTAATPVSQVLHRLNTKEEEWMYQLKHIEDDDGATPNSIALAVLNNDWVKANALAEELEGGPGSLPPRWANVLKQQHYCPVQHGFHECPANTPIALGVVDRSIG